MALVFLLRHFGQFSQNFVKTRRKTFYWSIFGHCHRIYLIFLVILKKCVYDRKTTTAVHQYVLAAVYVLN